MKQPEALRLAEGNDECAKAWMESSDAHKFRKETAAELRRLHYVNQELLEALSAVVANANGDARIGYYDVPVSSIKNARAAIAKAGGAS